MSNSIPTVTHLKQLEAESIHIFREVAAEFDNPVMLYSVGKDSSVLLHLARKAFAPTTWEVSQLCRLRLEEEAQKDLMVEKQRKIYLSMYMSSDFRPQTQR